MKQPKNNLKKPLNFEVSSGSVSTQKQNKEIYDVIHSDELHELYQKNAQLLSQLSATGRHNNILQSELSELIQEKSHLDIKNTDLIKEVHTLKKEVSTFHFQHERFNSQSLRLKKEMGAKIPLDVTPDQPSYPEKTFREIYTNLKEKYDKQMHNLQVLEKKEIVYKNQIKNLESHYLNSKNKGKAYAGQIQELKSSPQFDKKREEQIELRARNNYQEEIDTLKESYGNLRQVISQQEEGFKQTLQGMRRKHLQNSEQPNQSLEREKAKIQNLKLKVNKILRQNILLKKELKESQNPDLEVQEKIKNTQLNFYNKEQELKESYAREKKNIENENETYKKQLEQSYNNRLRHIRAEIENDLCSEKRRVEVLKAIKDKQVADLKDQLQNLQYQMHELKASDGALKKSHADIEQKLHDEIIKNENLKTQNKQLENLWQSLQQNIEERNQQVSSLQKLNRELSLALNQKSQPAASFEKELKKSSFLSTEEPESFIENKDTSTKDQSTIASEIIADIHFDR